MTHVLDGAGWDCRELLAGETRLRELECVGAWGAWANCVIGRVTAVSARSGIVCELGLEIGKVVVGADRASTDSDEPILVALLRVLIDQATTVDTSHFCVIQSGDLLESTSVGVATILGKA